MGAGRSGGESPGVVCWQCNARLRADQLICGRCGATRPTARLRAMPIPDPSPAQYRASWREDSRPGAAVYVPGGVYPDDEPSSPSVPSTLATDPDYRSGTLAAQPVPQLTTTGEPLQDTEASSAPAAEPLSIKALSRALARAFFQATAELWRATGFALLGALVGGGLWLVVAFAFQYESGFLAVALGACVGEGLAIGIPVRRPRYTLYATGLFFFFWAICIRVLAANDLNWSPLDGAYLFFAFIACTLPVRHLPTRSFQRRAKAKQGLV